MDKITTSLLAEFSEEHGIASLTEDRRFEHFTGYLAIRGQYSESFDTSDVVVGSGGDTGIDVVAVIVNGEMITDVEEIEDIGKKATYLDVQFILVQSERSSSFDSAKIGQFSFGAQDLFRDKPLLIRNEFVKSVAEVIAAIYDRSGKFKRGNPVCRLYYMTTGKWVSDKVLEARRKSAIADLESLGLFREVQFHCIGADGIQKLYNQTRNAIAREFQFSDKAAIPEIPGVSEAYLGFVSAETFLSIVCDQNNQIIKSLFYDNVRDWQDYNSVNREIAETLVGVDKARFVLMNNGITIIARTIRPTGQRIYIEDFQIVNGCQTSHVLADQFQNIDGTVMVPLRLIGTQDEDVINAVIQATNRQTEVKQEQFFALTDFAKKLEIYFSTFPETNKLYYERRSHQYDSMPIEKTRIVTPSSVIRAFAATFLSEPHSTTRSYGSLRERVGKEIFAASHKPDPYYVAAYMLYRLEYLFRNQRLDSKYKPARYHILLAARILAKLAPLPKPNANEMEKYCAALSEIIWDSSKAEKLLLRAAKAVESVAKGNFDRDNIRTLPFTQQIIASCEKIIK